MKFKRPQRFWKPHLGHLRCICKEHRELTRLSSKLKIKRTGVGEGLPISYPLNELPDEKTFRRSFVLKYEGKLSSLTKAVLTSLTSKYIYYAIDDILYLLDAKSEERTNLLEFLYSSMLLLHNNFSINFFDMWIDKVYINQTYKQNRFLTNKSENLKQVNYITLKLFYIVRSPIKKPEPIW